MATTGDLNLATSGDFYMATDSDLVISIAATAAAAATWWRLHGMG
jgi:hypothetical protein